MINKAQAELCNKTLCSLTKASFVKKIIFISEGGMKVICKGILQGQEKKKARSTKGERDKTHHCLRIKMNIKVFIFFFLISLTSENRMMYIIL